MERGRTIPRSGATVLANRIATLLLCGLGVFLTGCGAETESPTMNDMPRRVDLNQFQQLIEAGGVVLLDVRTPEEFQSGHIPAAINLDVNSSGFGEAIRMLDTNATYLVYCGSGRRSQRACGLLEAAGIAQLHDLAPGITGWKAAGMPVER